jgi:hypothetical protein
MSPGVKRGIATALMIALLRSSAGAEPTAAGTSPHDQDGAKQASPWIDVSPTPVLAVTSTPPKTNHNKAAAWTLAGLYAGFIGWTYIAWYSRGCPRSDDSCPEFRWADPKKEGSWRIWTEDGWFGKNGYAGGADKMGHMWATMSLARLGTEMLNQWGGYDRLTSAIVGTSLSELLFLGVEFRDGTSYVFSQGDFTFNTIGAGLAFAQSVWPAVDDAVDFRVEYFPSKAYRDRLREKSDLDVAEDYSGQSYHLAFHLGAIGPLARWKYGAWSKYVDLTIGFESNGYKPDPLYKPNPDPMTCPMEMNCDFDKERNIFLGLSLNMQGVFDSLLGGGKHEAARKLTHATFEVFAVPYTTLRVGNYNAVPDGFVSDEQ